MRQGAGQAVRRRVASAAAHGSWAAVVDDVEQGPQQPAAVPRVVIDRAVARGGDRVGDERARRGEANVGTDAVFTFRFLPALGSDLSRHLPRDQDSSRVRRLLRGLRKPRSPWPNWGRAHTGTGVKTETTAGKQAM